MKPYERQIQDMQHYANCNERTLYILYSGVTLQRLPPGLGPWSCTLGHGGKGGDSDIYHAYGVSLPDAIGKCYQRWQKGISGYDK